MALVAMCLLCLSMPAHALTISDPAGDSSVAGINDPTRGDATDILEITVSEQDQSFTIGFLVANAQPPNVPLADTVDYSFWFSHRDQRYEVRAFQEAQPTGTGVLHEVGASLRSVDAFGATQTLADLDVEIEGNLLNIQIPRELLVDSAGAAPFPGRVLHDLVGQVRFRETQSIGSGNGDLAPDNGFWSEDYLVTLGGQTSSGLRLSSSEPFRLSNGEATTFLYSVELTNDLDEAIDYVLDTRGTPQNWDIRIPSPSGTLDPLTSIVVPVAVRIPFAHKHDDQQSFTLVAASVDDKAIQGELKLGVTFTTTPQPTGHHPTVYLHAGAPPPDRQNQTLGPLAPARPYFNADPEDARGTGKGLGSSVVRAPLDPVLGVGLQLANRTTVGTIPVRGSNHDVAGLSLEGSIDYRHANGSYEQLFAIASADAINLAAGGSGELEVVLTKVVDASRLPYQKGAQLDMTLFLSWDAPNLDGPSILPGAAITLPLDEYHDAISEQFAFITKVVLSIPEPQRTGNPGGIIMVPWRIENMGDRQIDVTSAVTGLHASWATIIDGRQVLEPGQVHEGKIRIHIPDDAATGERADLLLEIYAPGLVGVGRVVVDVVTDIKVPSDPDVDLRSEKQASGASVVVVIGLLAAIVLLRRRT